MLFLLLKGILLNGLCWDRDEMWPDDEPRQDCVQRRRDRDKTNPEEGLATDIINRADTADSTRLSINIGMSTRDRERQ